MCRGAAANGVENRMSSGLLALLDDVALIARAAAASMDDVAAGVAKAGAKAAGVVIDDAAVTPAYATGFTPDRELPIIWKIARGSLRNKLLVLLPVALVLSQFLAQAITPLLMLGGLYLCFEGAEKVAEKILHAKPHHADRDGPLDEMEGYDLAAFETERVSGAVRTDLILSAEIMAISLGQVEALDFIERAVVLALVGVGMTMLVYGAVALLVKLDDIGLHMAGEGADSFWGRASRRIGVALLRGTPRLLDALGGIGTVAMLWVGGGILLHGAEELGWHAPAGLAHAVEHALGGMGGAPGAALGWIGYAASAAVAGLVAGALAVGVVMVQKRLRR
jgi:predicted DNA repair protein MutK